MSILSSVDTSQYTTPLAASFETSALQPLQQVDDAKMETPNVAAEEEDTPKVDLNNYYSNVRPSDLNGSNVQGGVSQASQSLTNAVSVAVEHGMNPQDAINIQKAKVAYEASVKASQTSTFQINVE